MVEPAPTHQSTLDDWSGSENHHTSLVVPATINWKAMRGVYEFQPESYEELVAVKCVGLSTARGLSLVAELIYGERAGATLSGTASHSGARTACPFQSTGKPWTRPSTSSRQGSEPPS